MTFQKKLEAIIKKNNSLVCVGLDSDINKIPAHIRRSPHSQLTFNKSIIEATHDLVCGYKLNTAFYESLGAKGIEELKATCDYLRKKYPELVIILDAKRGDIGYSNENYARFAFDYLAVDAITLHPYLGKEALLPFLRRKDKGCIILCRTSNPGAGEFQDLMVNFSNNQLKESIPLYKMVAEKVVKEWNTNNNCMLVVGATYPEELAEIRKIVGEMTLLVPGIGAQGGDLKAVLKAGLNSKGEGLIINSSRSIIFAKNPKEEARKLKEIINRYRKKRVI